MISILMSSLLLFGTHPPSVQVRRTVTAPWTVTVKTDLFTGTTSCAARAHGVRVEGSLAIFDLGANVNTGNAYYRLDLGPALPAQGSTVDEAVAFNMAEKHRLTNQTGGRVGLLSTKLIGVGRVDIRASSASAVQTFDIRGLDRVREIEVSAGCQDAVGVPLETSQPSRAM